MPLGDSQSRPEQLASTSHDHQREQPATLTCTLLVCGKKRWKPHKENTPSPHRTPPSHRCGRGAKASLQLLELVAQRVRDVNSCCCTSSKSCVCVLNSPFVKIQLIFVTGVQAVPVPHLSLALAAATQLCDYFESKLCTDFMKMLKTRAIKMQTFETLTRKLKTIILVIPLMKLVLQLVFCSPGRSYLYPLLHRAALPVKICEVTLRS